MNHLIELSKAINVLFDTQDTALLLVPFVRDLRMRGGTLFLAGNGGSFATALHWACDLTKVCAVRTHVLGASSALHTAYANDDSYAAALGNELSRSAHADDALVALSCSGTSPNIYEALKLARERRLRTALLTGLVNIDTAPADLTIRVQSKDYATIEDCHSILGHWLTKELAQ